MTKRTEHDCPKKVNTSSTGLETWNFNIHCDVCESNAKVKWATWLPYLPELKAWVEDGSDYSSACSEMLYEYFMEDLDYGTLTGDTGTIDEWLCDRVDQVQDIVDTIEFYHPSEAA